MPTKSLIQSKIFWLALVSFILSLLSGFTHKEFGPGTADQIVALDWGNISQALLSVGIILARWFFTSTRIGGVFTAVPRSVYMVLALALLSSSSALAASRQQPYRAWQWQAKPAEIGIYVQYWCSPWLPIVAVAP